MKAYYFQLAEIQASLVNGSTQKDLQLNLYSLEAGTKIEVEFDKLIDINWPQNGA